MAENQSVPIRVLRRSRVEDRTGVKRSTLYRWRKERAFPRPIPLGAKAVGWIESEVEEWLEDRAAMREAGGASRAR